MMMFRSRIAASVRLASVRYASTVTASMVKELRVATGAPMMECKRALSDPEVAGDISKGIDWLRKRGVAAAAKKSGRSAKAGLVGVTISPDTTGGVLVEVRLSHCSRAMFVTVLLTLVWEGGLSVSPCTAPNPPSSCPSPLRALCVQPLLSPCASTLR
jgi:hypothetical protein